MIRRRCRGLDTMRAQRAQGTLRTTEAGMQRVSITAAAIGLVLVSAAGCATSQHWVRGATGVQETEKDLRACGGGSDPGRPTAASSMAATFEQEAPCMRSKGYILSR
jgi:hypothetical protein